MFPLAHPLPIVVALPFDVSIDISELLPPVVRRVINLLLCVSKPTTISSPETPNHLVVPSDFFMANKSFVLVSGFVWRVYISPKIGSGSVPTSPNGQPSPVGEICFIEEKLPVSGFTVPKSCVEPEVDLTP